MNMNKLKCLYDQETIKNIRYVEDKCVPLKHVALRGLRKLNEVRIEVYQDSLQI